MTGDDGFRPIGVEAPGGQRGRGGERPQECRRQHRSLKTLTYQAEQRFGRECEKVVETTAWPAVEGAVGVAVVRPEFGRRSVEVAPDDRRVTVVEGVGDGGLRVDPPEAVSAPVDRAHERRRDGQRVDGGAEVVNGSGGVGEGSGRSSDLVVGLEDQHRSFGPCEGDRTGQPIGPGSNDDDVMHSSKT